MFCLSWDYRNDYIPSEGKMSHKCAPYLSPSFEHWWNFATLSFHWSTHSMIFHRLEWCHLAPSYAPIDIIDLNSTNYFKQSYFKICSFVGNYVISRFASVESGTRWMCSGGPTKYLCILISLHFALRQPVRELVSLGPRPDMQHQVFTHQLLVGKK